MPSLSEPGTHDWRQGRFASESVAERIKATNLALTRAVGSGDIFIIASQDCDICCDSYEEEPMFEVVLARHLPDDSEDGNLFSGKNPRRLQMRIERKRQRKPSVPGMNSVVKLGSE